MDIKWIYPGVISPLFSIGRKTNGRSLGGLTPKKTHVFFKQPFPNTTKSPTAPTAAAKGHLKLRSQTKSWRVFGKGRRFVSCQPNQHIKAWAIWVLNLKWWVLPQIIHFNRVFRYKPSILGYHYFRKHPISE